MYLCLGRSAAISEKDVVGIFDLDNTSWAFKTRQFLERAERENKTVWLTEDLPRCFVLCRDGRVYMTQLSAAAVKARAEAGLA